MRGLFLAWSLVSFFAAVVGCATTDYLYQPAIQSNAQANGYPAAYFQIPPEKPTGDVRVASFGVTQLKDGDQKTSAVQIRMVVANNQDAAPWSLDTRETLLALDNLGESQPALVKADGGTPPVLKIPRGQKVTLDLYYPLPPPMAKASKLPAFDLLWKVDTGSGLVAQRTPFERKELGPAYAYYPYAWVGFAYPYGWARFYPYGPYGWGPYGWYPFYGPSVGVVVGGPVHDHGGHPAGHPVGGSGGHPAGSSGGAPAGSSGAQPSVPAVRPDW